MPRELLFSVTIKDCDVDTFRSGGPGGQNQNKVESGVRITHRDSGAIGESRETRDQLLNKRKAFRKMVETPIFKKWHKIEIAKRMGQPSLLSIVKKEMNPNNIIVESKENNKWIKNEELKPTLQEINNLFEENNNE